MQTFDLSTRSGCPGSVAAAAARGAVLLAWLSVASGSLSGIPEPDLIWYGQVVSRAEGDPVRVVAGTLEWRIEPLGGGPPWVLSTTLTNLNDQVSFLLRVRFETPEPGVAATPETVQLTAPATAYRRLTVTLDGEPLAVRSVPTQFAPAPSDRGRSERIDLELTSLPLDTDGDGLADAWELQYFGGLDAGPDEDPDGDGFTNLQEYRAGTHPLDPQSLLALVEMRRVPQGLQLRWSSQANKRYRVLRSPTLLAPPGTYQTIGSNLVATPPINEFVDGAAMAGENFFYRIQLED